MAPRRVAAPTGNLRGAHCGSAGGGHAGPTTGIPMEKVDDGLLRSSRSICQLFSRTRLRQVTYRRSIAAISSHFTGPPASWCSRTRSTGSEARVGTGPASHQFLTPSGSIPSSLARVVTPDGVRGFTRCGVFRGRADWVLPGRPWNRTQVVLDGDLPPSEN